MMPSAGLAGAVATALGMATAGSVTLEILVRRRPERDWSTMRRTVHMWWPIIVTSSVMVVGGKWATTVGMALVSWQLLREYLRLTLDPRDRALRNAAVVAVPLHYLTIALGLDGLFTIGPVFWGLFVLPVVAMFTGSVDGLPQRVARTQWGLLSMVWGASHVAWLLHRDLGDILPAEALGTLLLLTFSGDAMQWVWGKIFGRTPLVPRISPKKTWEGLIGGALTVVAIALLVAPMVDLDWLLAAVLAVVIVLAGLLGDLVISAIKRDAGAKDSGTLLLGQGGLLDRLDGVLFTVPLGAQLLVAWVQW